MKIYIFFLFVLMIGIFSSCGDKCAGVVCINGEHCENGICVSNPLPEIYDIDGNVYHEIQIGSQYWMKENLRVTRYRNGDSIPTGLNDSQWNALSSGAYSVFNDTLFGNLYNWYAVNDSRCLCPTGWHVPTETDWQTLGDYLGGTAGGKMKTTDVWSNPNIGATNSSGFTALPGGARSSVGSYYASFDNGFWWTSTPFSATSSKIVVIQATSDALFLGSSYGNRMGSSIRCIKD